MGLRNIYTPFPLGRRLVFGFRDDLLCAKQSKAANREPRAENVLLHTTPHPARRKKQTERAGSAIDRGVAVKHSHQLYIHVFTSICNVEQIDARVSISNPGHIAIPCRYSTNHATSHWLSETESVGRSVTEYHSHALIGGMQCCGVTMTGSRLTGVSPILESGGGGRAGLCAGTYCWLWAEMGE